MKIYVGYDHRGDKLALRVIEWLLNNGYEVNTPFEESQEGDDYPDIAKVVCKCVKEDQGSVGLLICGTGIGMCMAANKEKQIRAVLAHSEEDAYFARRHEDANVLVLPAGYSDGKQTVKVCGSKTLRIIESFLKTDFEGGRHIRRIEKMEKTTKK